MKKKFISSAIALALALPIAAISSDINASTSDIITGNTAVNKILNFDVATVPNVNKIQDTGLTALMNLSDNQADAISQFLLFNPNAQININEATGTVDAIIGMAVKTSGNSVENMARNFITDNLDF